jgi:hypothetical protein
MDAINRYKAKKAADDVAGTIANGGIVRESEKSYSELAAKSRLNENE